MISKTIDARRQKLIDEVKTFKNMIDQIRARLDDEPGFILNIEQVVALEEVRGVFEDYKRKRTMQ